VGPQIAPNVLPDVTLSAPGVEGPKVSLQELSLIAKCWA
jgi:hypothetical protein